MDKFEDLCNRHQSRSFPAGYAGKKVGDINLMILDSELSSCFFTSIQTDGRLGPRMLITYETSMRSLEKILPGLEGEVKEYFIELQVLGRMLGKVMTGRLV